MAAIPISLAAIEPIDDDSFPEPVIPLDALRAGARRGSPHLPRRAHRQPAVALAARLRHRAAPRCSRTASSPIRRTSCRAAAATDLLVRIEGIACAEGIVIARRSRTLRPVGPVLHPDLARDARQPRRDGEPDRGARCQPRHRRRPHVLAARGRVAGACRVRSRRDRQHRPARRRVLADQQQHPALRFRRPPGARLPLRPHRCQPLHRPARAVHRLPHLRRRRLRPPLRHRDHRHRRHRRAAAPRPLRSRHHPGPGAVHRRRRPRAARSQCAAVRLLRRAAPEG